MIKILKRTPWLAACLLALFLVSSCGEKAPKYIIGVSQCSEDSWRAKLQDELIMATYFNEGVELRFTSAHDDSRLQEKQIDSLVNSGIDLLIVSPNQVDNLTEAIGKAYAKKIPVVLYDRKTNNEQFTAFMGADNYHIGEMLGQYLAGKLGIVEEDFKTSWKNLNIKPGLSKEAVDHLNDIREWAYNAGRFEAQYDIVEFFDADAAKIAFPERVTFE